MATFCENCGKQLSQSDSFKFKGLNVCGGCQKKLESQMTKKILSMAHQQQTSESKGKAASAGWQCFGVGVLVLFLSSGVPLAFQFGTSIIGGLLFLAAFILSIVAMVQGRTASGIVLLLATIAVPPIIWLGIFVVKVSDTYSAIQKEKQNAISAISFEEVEATSQGNYMYCKGKVRNNGTTPLSYVKVGVEWLDGRDKILDTDFTYAVSSEGLQPGAAKSFSIMSEADGRMKRFRYYVIRD